MKRRNAGCVRPVLVAVLLLGLLPAASVVARGQPADSVGPGGLYLALGDSVAAGVGASRPAERGYPAILKGYLDALIGTPIEHLNLAVPGETSASLLGGEQLREALRSLDAARRAGLRPGPITLTIGGNDLLRAGSDPLAREAALRDVGANVRAILDRLSAAARDGAGPPTADLVVTGYYDPTGTPPQIEGTDAWWLARLNATLAGEANRAGAHWVDVAAAFRGRETHLTWFPSDIHPTNEGHAAIAAAVWQSLGYDATAPSLRIERPRPGPLGVPVPTLAVGATDDVGVVEVTLTVDGVPAGAIPYRAELGLYTVLWDARNASPGPHTLEITARDSAGNRAIATVVVTIPAPSAASPTAATPTG